MERSIPPALARLLGLLTLAAGPARAGEKKPIPLPEDGKTVVLSLDYVGGLRPPRKDEPPVLSVRADGSVLAPDRREGLGTAKLTLSRNDLQELVAFAVREQKIFEIDQKTLDERVRAAAKARGVPVVLDASTTVVMVRTRDRSVRLRQHALSFRAEKCPEVAELAHLAAVARRLERLRVVTTAGGEEAVGRYVALVNAALSKVKKEAEPFRAEDLEDASLLEGGGRRLRFFRRGADGKGISAVVSAPKGGEAKVTIG